MRTKTRFFCLAAVVATLGGGSLIAMGATATASSLKKGQVPIPTVYAGYTDSFRNGTPNTPSPWKGAPSLIFKGCNYFHPDRCPKSKNGKDLYDSGAIRILNTTQATITISHVVVGIGSCTFHPWPKLSVTLTPEQQLVLTQTGGNAPCGHARGKYNFDGSDTSNSCTNNNVIPLVTITIDEETVTWGDPNQILNTAGKDIGKKACGHHNETQDWGEIFLPCASQTASRPDTACAAAMSRSRRKS